MPLSKRQLSSGAIRALVCAILSFVPFSILACSCGERSSVEGAYQETPVVFVGKVTQVRRLRGLLRTGTNGLAEKLKELFGSEPGADYLENYGIDVFFEIETPLKGGEKIGPIRTGFGGGDCGFEFIEGHRYLVYAYKRGSGLGTGTCTRTKQLERATSELRQLLALQKKAA